MTISIRFNAGECWSYGGRRLRFERHLGDNLLYFLDEARLCPFQIEGDIGELCAPNIDWATHAFAVGDLKRLRDPQGPPVRKKAALQEIGPDEAQKLDPMARFRAFVVRGLDALPKTPRSDRSYRIALAKLWAAHPQEVAHFPAQPSPRAARRWMNTRCICVPRMHLCEERPRSLMKSCFCLCASS